MSNDMKNPLNLDGLVARTIGQATWETKDSYVLSIQVENEWDDPVAGAKWEDARQELTDLRYTHNWRDVSAEARASIQDMEVELRDRRPAQHEVKYYALKSRTRSGISITPDLGEMIKVIWTTRPRKYSPGQTEMVGRLTLTSIMARLGRKDVSGAVKEQQEVTAARVAKERRNNIRANTSALIARLREYVEKNGAEIGLNTASDPNLWAIVERMVNTPVEA